MSDKGMRFLRIRVTYSCEQPWSAENQTQVLFKSNNSSQPLKKDLNLSAISLGHQYKKNSSVN